MKETKETLWADYNKVSKQIEELDVKDENYELLLEERDKLRNELIKLDTANMEIELKRDQIKAEDKREKIRNCITITTFSVTTLVSVCSIVKTFKFDEGATVTSTLGRNILSSVVPKMFKR